MKAHFRSIRIAPKKAELIAKMVRGKSVPEAISLLTRTNKGAARLLLELIRSAASNARHNDNQDAQMMVVKIVTVNKAGTFHRGVPMARGRIRPIRKFQSHIAVTLGYPEERIQKKQKSQRIQKKRDTSSKKSSASSDSSESSASS